MPVIAAGIPTLMKAQEGKDLVVTPRELDSVIAHGAALLAGINRALQPRLSVAQLCWLGLTGYKISLAMKHQSCAALASACGAEQGSALFEAAVLFAALCIFARSAALVLAAFGSAGARETPCWHGAAGRGEPGSG